MLGKRLEQADRIAARRAAALPMDPKFSQAEFHKLSRYNTKEDLHREIADRPVQHFRKGKGACGCPMCVAAKAKRSKGEGKRDWRRARGLD